MKWWKIDTKNVKWNLKNWNIIECNQNQEEKTIKNNRNEIKWKWFGTFFFEIWAKVKNFWFNLKFKLILTCIHSVYYLHILPRSTLFWDRWVSWTRSIHRKPIGRLDSLEIYCARPQRKRPRWRRLLPVKEKIKTCQIWYKFLYEGWGQRLSSPPQ